MPWVKALHIISMVAWFSGLFYLPRLYVYHSMATDTISIERFKVMERKLYYFIMTPAAILTVVFGVWILSNFLPVYMKMKWVHIKLALVLGLIAFHLYLGMLLNRFKNDHIQHGTRFYRILNEVPVFFLVSIVILVIVRPFGSA